MELRHLRYFVMVAREQSFTRAAEKLHIAQPPLSRQIQQLEEELGVALIQRSSRPAFLTEAGRLLYEQAIQVLDRVDEIRGMMRRLREAHRGRFGVGFVGSTLYGKLPEVIRRFRAVRPNVEVVLTELTSLEQVAALKEGRIDVGFGRISVDDPSIARQLLRNERLVVALPLDHPLLMNAAPLRLTDLVGEPLVLYPKAPRPSYADQVLALFRNREIKPHSTIEVRELQTALGLVAAQAGIAVVPSGVQRLRRDGVIYRDLDEEDAASPIILVHRQGERSSEVAAIVELIQEVYREEGITFGA